MISETPHVTTDFVRSRASSWGGAGDREALQRTAADVARRAGFKVCAIEVLRSDDMLEFVAIHGSPDGSERLLGVGSPLEAMTPAFNCGADCGAFTFVAAEWLTEEAFDQIATYGHVPQVPDSDDQNAWRSEDMLAVRLRGSNGVLRAVLYLDEPLSGMRLRSEELLALSADLDLTFRAIVTTVERELFVQQYRLAHVAREVIRSASNQLGVDQLLGVARTQLTEGFRATDAHVHLFEPSESDTVGQDLAPFGTPELQTALEAVVAHAATLRQVVIIERDEVWGPDSTGLEEHTDLLKAVIEKREVATLVVVPVTEAGRLLGALVIERSTSDARWSDTESKAALEVGQDLGRAILDARAFEREQRLNAELRRLDEFRTELIATVAHEMKNPIGVILGHLEMLEDHPAVTPEIAPSLVSITRAGTRLESLSDSLLTFSRVGDPGQSLAQDRVDLAALVAETTDLTTLMASKAQVEVEVAPTIGETVVVGDQEDLRHVVSNLLSNAVKYSEPRTTVRLALERVDDQVLLTVADEGLGISEVDQKRLFTEFFRSTNPRARARPGTGLGLAIVRRIVTRHGGTIEAESTLGEGTTFRVVLPVA